MLLSKLGTANRAESVAIALRKHLQKILAAAPQERERRWRGGGIAVDASPRRFSLKGHAGLCYRQSRIETP